MAFSLYSLTTELLELEDDLAESGGELTPELEEKYSDLLESLAHKAGNIAQFIRNLKAKSTAITEERKRLQAMEKTIAKSVDSLMSRMHWSLTSRGMTTAETPVGKFSISARGKGRTVPLVEPEDLPDRFRKVSYTADLTALREALDNQDDEAVRLAEVVPPSEKLYFR